MEREFTIEELPEIAEMILRENPGHLILFYGEVGVGKTTLIKEMLKQSGVEDNVNSPTFALVNEYLNASGEVFYHLDLYRVKDVEELVEIGIDEYLSGESLCLIEWPELLGDFAKDIPNFSVFLKHINNGKRKLTTKIYHP